MRAGTEPETLKPTTEINIKQKPRTHTKKQRLDDLDDFPTIFIQTK